MSKKKLLYWVVGLLLGLPTLLFLVFFIVVSIFMANMDPGFGNANKLQKQITNSTQNISTKNQQLAHIKIHDQTLTVEVVSTPQDLTKGLGGRDQIGSDGMLFVLGTPQTASFWMKDMKFDLDMVWIGNGQILGITANVAYPRDQKLILPVYNSPPRTDMVLEVTAGTAQRSGWQEGDRVILW